MASINKLSVRGVRSFSPEDEEQIIEFNCPLTIIMGENGCGKTTIIESLKYAITGALPPDSRKGQSFVHDAKSIGQQQVKATVKLRFTSKSEQTMVVVRSMELTQKKTTMSFKQLDGVLRTRDPRTDERESLSHKCTELDKIVPQLMGVSKPILEHVLFCHQEDSSWPLMDSAALKKRFDEIFDNEKYTKAIEVFKKKEKSYNSIAKDLKADIAGLESHKHAAKGFRKELDEQHEVMEEIDETKIKLKRQMAKVDETIAKYEGIVDQLSAVDNDIKIKEEALVRQQAVIQKQREMLEVDLTETQSLAELKTKLRDFDRTMATQQEQLRALEEEREGILGVVASLRDQEMELSNKTARYEIAKEEHQKRLRQRCSLLESIAQNHSLDLELSQAQADQSFTASVTATSKIASDIGTQGSLISFAPEDMQRFFEMLNREEEDLKAKMDARKKRSKNAEEEMQKEIQDLVTSLSVARSKLENLRTEKENLREEQVELSKQVSTHSRLRKSDVEEARKKANKLAKQRDDVANNHRQQEIKTESRSLEDKIDKLKRQIDENDRILRDSLRVSAEAQHSITLLEEQCTTDIKALEEALREQASTFQKFDIPLVDSLPKEGDENGDQIDKSIEDLKKVIKQKFDDEDAGVSRANEELSRTQKILSEKTALMTYSQQTMKSLKPKIDRLNDSVEKAKKVAQDLRRHDTVLGLSVRVNEQSPEELLTYIDERLDTLEEDSPVEISLSAMKEIVRRLQRMAKVEDPNGIYIECPCCKREFGRDPDAPDYSQDVKVFQDTLTYLSSEESPLLKVDTKYQETKANYEGWKKTLVDCMNDLRDHQRMNQELKDVEAEHQRLLEDISHFHSHFRKQQSEFDDLQSTHEELRDLLYASKRWGDDAYRVSHKRMQIAQKSIDLAASVGGDMKRDLKAVECDLNRMIEEKDEWTNQLKNLSREMEQIDTTNNSLAQQASQMDQIAHEKELRYATEQQSSQRKAEVAERLRAIGLGEKELQNRIAHLEKELSGKKDEKEKEQALYEEEGNALSSELNSFTSEVKTLHSLTIEIDNYERSNQQREQQKLAEKASSIKTQIIEKEKAAEALQDRVDEMKRAVHDQERHKNLLAQNIDMLESRKLVGEITKEINELQERRSQIEEGDTAEQMYAEAKQKKEELQELKYRTEGRFSEVVEQIRSLKRKLSAPEYREVEEQYRVAMIKYETTTLAAQDLKKYYTALDKALVQFHGRKIADINRIIRELWMVTYRGRDITSLEIVSGQEPGSKASKSYNYRVVMSKGSSRLDMRGRCSAGQRVLASIVIRLALAETFGVNCGCIALDEPTVNLDSRNKKGLAVALAQIVANRSSQINFQLLMITHDEEFVSMMKTELSSLTDFSMPEKIFQVRREQHIDGKYYSKIDALDWNEMV